MNTLPKRNDYLNLLRDNTNYIDVRAPAEFVKGSLPGASNLPILNDQERAQVGVCHKSSGPEAATALGHKLVAGQLRNERTRAWFEAARAQPDRTVLMCWRGGQRSQIAQQWLADAGVTLPRVDGGFKALRAACIEQLNAFANSPTSWLLIGGRTGSGKTAVLKSVTGAIDLEAHAHHRGSAFGGYPDGQPTPINFENALAVASLRHTHHRVVLEDEGATIGRLGVPRSWHERMQSAPVVQLEVPQPERINNIFVEYVGTELTSTALAAQYVDALQRIRKRLGGARSAELQEQVRDAFSSGAPDAHRAWIKGLLDSYYDPMYDYQLKKKLARIEYRGSAEEVIAYLMS